MTRYHKNEHGETEFLSFGGGVNSVALLLLLRDEGWKGPAIFADHHGDWPETYEYLGYLAARGYEVERIDTGDIYDYYWNQRNMPFRIARWCTRMFKLEPLRKHTSQWSPCVHLIGIAADESHRAVPREWDGGRADYPLVERGLSRRDCLDIIAAHGLEPPMKSGCYFCPFQRDSMVRELAVQHPELLCRVKKLEDRANERIAEKGLSPLYLYNRPVMTVAEVGQQDLFREVPPCVCMV